MRAHGTRARRQTAADDAELTCTQDFGGEYFPRPPSANSLCGAGKETSESSAPDDAELTHTDDFVGQSTASGQRSVRARGMRARGRTAADDAELTHKEPTRKILLDSLRRRERPVRACGTRARGRTAANDAELTCTNCFVGQSLP